MSVIRERALRPYIALETFQPTANPFVIGAGRIGASKLRPAGTPIVWRDWTNNVLNIDASRGGKAVDIAHVNDVGTLSVTLRDLSLDMQNPEFVAGQRVRLIHVNGTKRHAIFTGSIQEIELHRLRFASRRAPVSVLQFVAVDAVRAHNEITRYGALPETGTETLAARLDRLSRTADAPIAQPTEPIPGLLGRTVYESSISNHLDIACNTVGAFWYVDGDGITRVARRRQTPQWAEVRRNRAKAPRPTVFATSEWAAAGAFRQIPEPGWVGGVLGATDTPYIFTGRSDRAYAAGEKVTLSIRFRVTGLDSPTRYVTAMPHVRTGNIYHRAGYQVVRRAVIGRDEDVVIRWITPVAIAAGAGLDVALVASDAAGSVAFACAAGFGLWATRALIEDGWTDGAFYDGSTNPSGITERTRWEGTVNLSASILERPSNVATIAERREEFPGVKFPEGTLQLIRYTGARGSRVTYTGLDYDNHGAQIDPENPGAWLADDQLYHGVRLDSATRYGLRVATLPTNFPDDPGATGGHDLVVPYGGDSILVETLVWNAQEDLSRVPDLDVGSYIDLPMIGDMSVGVLRSYIVGGVRHTITPTRWLIELSLIGVQRAL